MHKQPSPELQYVTVQTHVLFVAAVAFFDALKDGPCLEDSVLDERNPFGSLVGATGIKRPLGYS